MNSILFKPLDPHLEAGPECYQCTAISDPQLCTQKVYCGFEEQCYTERIQLGSHGFYYNMGCIATNLCYSIDNNDVLVGKRFDLADQATGRRKRDPACKQCCREELCNLPLCSLPADTATIPPAADIYARLLGGKTPYEGTVEVFYGGRWGAICNDDWTHYDAQVFCNMLGYTGDGARAKNGSVINSDQSKVWRDQFECRGIESGLAQCVHGTWEMRDCENRQIAGAICSSESADDGSIFLLDSANNTMARMDLKTKSFTYIPMLGLYNPGPFDFDPVQGRIYFADQTYKQINSMKSDGTDIVNFRQLEQNSSPGKTKVDPINRMLFYTDYGLNVIASVNLDGSHFQNVISSGLDSPRGLTLNPKTRTIFWTDWGQNPRIESASYDGTNRQVLISTDIRWPNSIAIDLENNRLYYVDGTLGKIESSDLSGNDRQIIFRDNGAHFYGIDVFGGYIYYTDWARSMPMRLNKDGTGLTSLGAPSFLQLSDIKVYQYNKDTSGEATVSPSVLSPKQTFLHLVGDVDSTTGRVDIYINGQWGTVCADKWTDNEAMVACHMLGFDRSLAKASKLPPTSNKVGSNSLDSVQCNGTEDNIVFCNVSAQNWAVHDCSYEGAAGLECENLPPHEMPEPVLDHFILFNDVFEGVMVRMDIETFSYTTVPLQLTNFTPIALTFDPTLQQIYFSEVKNQTSAIRQTDLRGAWVSTLGYTPQGSVIDGMAFDNKRNMIFYTDAGNNRIVSISPDGSNLNVVSFNIEQPKGLALDTNAAVVYWTDCGSQAKIESANYDGTNRRTILAEDLRFPYGIALDVAAGQLYFCDAGTKTIEVVNTDGTRRKMLYKDFRSACYGLALTSQYIFYSDWTKMNVVRINRDGSNQTPAGPDSFSQVFDVYAFDSTFTKT
ncbi:low-density lipoprotein receptor-related protein 4 [Biomphalaria glabrata]|nr:low-density lipoprotein receptor-related protein 4 [Biomphalaria glabrata]